MSNNKVNLPIIAFTLISSRPLLLSPSPTFETLDSPPEDKKFFSMKNNQYIVYVLIISRMTIKMVESTHIHTVGPFKHLNGK